MNMTVGNKLHITGSITDGNNTPVTGSKCTLKINDTSEEVTLTNGTIDTNKTFDRVGDYDVCIGYDGVESTVTSVTVLKAEPSIGVTGYTDTMSSSDPLNIMATLLDNKGNPIKGASVRFKDLTTDYGTSTTGDDGKCGFTASNLTLGYHRFKVIYNGNDLYWATRTGFDVNVIKTKKNTNLSISLSSSSINLGESVTVTGTLVDEDGSAISGATVSLMVGSVDSSITNYSTVDNSITNSTGAVSFNYTPTEDGELNVKLSYAGNDEYSTSVSGVVTVTVVNSVLYQPALDGTESFTQVSGTTTIANGEMYGGVAFLNNGWDNSSDWKLTFQYKAQYGTSMWIAPLGQNRVDYNGLQLKNYNDNEISVLVNGKNNKYSVDANAYPNDTYVPVTIVKNSSTFTITINNYTYTVTWDNSSYSNLCIGVHSWEKGHSSYVKDIKVVRL